MRIALVILGGLLLLFSSHSCSTKKNTALTRTYHSINTRYNVHFNANEAFKESISKKEQEQESEDVFSQLLHIYPEILDTADLKYKGGFDVTIEKTTKAIKQHSIKTRPRRDPNKRGDKKYQEWTKQKEFNPFLVNTWMLLGKAEFENGNYLRAITTFMYITKIYENNKRVVSESKLWIARAYSEMGWKYEAENVLRKMEQNEEIHHELLGMYASIKANLYVRNKEYKNAIPYLEEAIKHEKSNSQKRRNRYLLGQLYAEVGENEKAYQAFGSVRGFNSPYRYVVSSRLRQIEVSGNSKEKMVSELSKMTKGLKNKEYLDQIYTALGNVYLNSSDTIEAIKNYTLAIEKSIKSTYDKALAQVKLGNLHFERKEYVQAQPHYAGALSVLRKTDESYPLVSLRSDVLDQLVVHAKVVQEQDSLLNLANMPEEERLAFLEEYIAQLKKENEQKEKEAELAARKDSYDQVQYTGWDDLNLLQQQESAMNTKPKMEVSDFYFYNESTIEQGKLAFQRKWGKRALEDDWRRKDKTTTDEFGNEDDLASVKKETDEDKLTDEDTTAEIVTDKYSIDYYLQQLPLTDEAKDASYKMIEHALFNMGLIYKNLLEDDVLAIETFETNLKRFPGTPNKEEIYYQLFLIYLKMDNEPLMALYRNLIINEFSQGQYAKPLADENYAWNFKYMAKLQEELYQATYQAYLDGDVKTVRENYTTMEEKYPFVTLMPKFAFLNSLSYAQTRDASQLEKNLKKVVADYPQSDVVPLATDILKNIKDGMILLSDGSPLVGMDWKMAYSNDSIFEGDSARTLAYQKDLDKPYMLLLMFAPKSVDRNELLYQVADYNFSNYVIQTYDLQFVDNPTQSCLAIKGFESFRAIKSYLQKSLEENGLLTKIDRLIAPIPISLDNYSNIYPRLGLEQYISFYGDSLGYETPQLIGYWDGAELNDLLVSDLPIEEVEKEEQAEAEVIIPETGEKKLTFIQLETQQREKQKEQKDKEIGLEDILSEDQLNSISDIARKKDDVIDALQDVMNNPVDGLKNIFNRKKLGENLTKEEKQQRKEAARILKQRTDSIKRVEQFRLDSIQQMEKAVQDSIQQAEEHRKIQLENEKIEQKRRLQDEISARRQEAIDKEKVRETQQKEKEAKRKEQDRERRELQKQREKERRELMKKRENERRLREKKVEDLRKRKEKERKKVQGK